MGGDRSGKEGAVATETGDLGGGLEVAEPLMHLWHRGCEGGVGAGAVIATGDTLHPVFAVGMELPASGRPLSPADDQRPCFSFPRPPTLKTSSSDLERKQAWLFCSGAVLRLCLYHLQQRDVIREETPSRGRQCWLFPFTLHFHALEKEMATHSSVLAWRIPGMEEPSGLPSVGSHRVGHD